MNIALENLIIGAHKFSSQEKLTKYLRELGFKFLDTSCLREHITLQSHHEKYQWMVRLIKPRKDPKKEVYDWNIAFGIKIVGFRIPLVQIYLDGNFRDVIRMDWEKTKGVNFKKLTQRYKFPAYMTILERKKWRTENNKLIKYVTLNGSDEGFPYSEKFLANKENITITLSS